MSICIIPEALPPAPSPRHSVLACNECGCREIETTAWVYIDWLTGQERIRDDKGPTDQAWCPDCDEEIRLPWCVLEKIHPGEIEAHVTSQQVNE